MVAADTAKRQDESDNSRRRLIEQSREFKRSATEVIRSFFSIFVVRLAVRVFCLSGCCYY